MTSSHETPGGKARAQLLGDTCGLLVSQPDPGLASQNVLAKPGSSGARGVDPRDRVVCHGSVEAMLHIRVGHQTRRLLPTSVYLEADRPVQAHAELECLVGVRRGPQTTAHQDEPRSPQVDPQVGWASASRLVVGHSKVRVVSDRTAHRGAPAHRPTVEAPPPRTAPAPSRGVRPRHGDQW